MNAILLLTFISSSIPFDVKADDLEHYRQEFCGTKTIIDAAMASETDRTHVYLFSGEVYFVMNLANGELIGVNKIVDKYPNLDTSIDASCIMDGSDPGGFVFIKDKDIYLYSSLKKPKLFNKTTVERYLLNFGVTLNDRTIGCLTCYCMESTACKMVLVFKNTHHKTIVCELDIESKLENCEQSDSIPTPPDVHIKLESKSECFALSYVPAKDQSSTILFIDEYDINFWIGDEQIYSRKIRDMFHCFSSAVLTIVFASVMCITIVVVVVACVFMYVTKQHTFQADDAATAVTSKVG